MTAKHYQNAKPYRRRLSIQFPIVLGDRMGAGSWRRDRMGDRMCGYRHSVNRPTRLYQTSDDWDDDDDWL